MKKYVKPELILERFELTEQIATGCSNGLIATYQDETTCKVENFNGVSGLILFGQSNKECTFSEYEGYCYHNGGDGFTIFTS